MNQWINVKDKLPDMTEKVTEVDGDREYTLWYESKPVLVFDETMYDENSRMQTAVLTDDGDWLTTFDEKRLENVTHWMPLPDEPKDNAYPDEAAKHLFELKTIETPSIHLEKVFGKYDKAKCKYRKEKHITDMVEAMGYSGQTAHVIVNYRAVNRTFAIPASKVLAFRYNESRKSIPWQWAEQEGIEVKAKSCVSIGGMTLMGY